MKKLIPLSTLAFLLSSCASTYIQVCTVALSPESDSKVEDRNGILVYEDTNCRVIYNMWSAGGNVNFTFQNTSDDDLYVMMDKSFFIKNGLANDYYIESTTTHKTSQSSNKSLSATAVAKGRWSNGIYSTPGTLGYGASAGISSTVGFEETVTASKVICVPAKSSKIISGFSIYDGRIKLCGDNNNNYPRKESKHTYYTLEDSPIVFENRICYSTDENLSNKVKVNTSFYLSEFVNYNFKQNVAFDYNGYDECGNKTVTYDKHLIVGGGANQFYNFYEQ